VIITQQASLPKKSAAESALAANINNHHENAAENSKRL